LRTEIGKGKSVLSITRREQVRVQMLPLQRKKRSQVREHHHHHGETQKILFAERVGLEGGGRKSAKAKR